MNQIDYLKKVLETMVLSGTVFCKGKSTSTTLEGLQAFLVFNAADIDGKIEYFFAAICVGKEELVGLKLDGTVLTALTNSRERGSCFITVPAEGTTEERLNAMRLGVINYNWRLMNIITPFHVT
jgi:hypothetical protein